jgi:hypothetical protein
MIRGGLVGLTLTILAVVAVRTLSTAAAGAAEEVRMQALMNRDGSGHLFVNDPGGPRLWEACTPDLKNCAPFGRGREVDTNGASPNTVFRVRGRGVGISPEWRGRLKQLAPPSVYGTIRAHEFVSPLPGRWRGGWRGEFPQWRGWKEGEFSELQLSACATPEGHHCTTLTDHHYIRGCPSSASFSLDARFTGGYLRVANRRVGAGPPIEPAYGVSSPYFGKVWGHSRSTSVAILGQIAPAADPYPGECGPPPPAEASISDRGVAFVECRGGCRAELIASHAGRKARVARRLPAGDALLVAPPDQLWVPQRRLTDIGAERIRFTVKINGKRAARRTVVRGKAAHRARTGRHRALQAQHPFGR